MFVNSPWADPRLPSVLCSMATNITTVAMNSTTVAGNSTPVATNSTPPTAHSSTALLVLAFEALLPISMPGSASFLLLMTLLRSQPFLFNFILQTHLNVILFLPPIHPPLSNNKLYLHIG